MASQVLSGSSNPSYTNNTGQNVRVIINYMETCTSMTWAGVTVTPTAATTVSKDNLQVQTTQVTIPITGSIGTPNSSFINAFLLSSPFSYSGTGTNIGSGSLSTIAYVPTSIGPAANLPVEIVLAPTQSFSSVCGAYNIVVIKEDGT